MQIYKQQRKGMQNGATSSKRGNPTQSASIRRQFIDTFFLEVTQSVRGCDVSAALGPVYAGPAEVPDVSDACYAKRSGCPLSC